jgi:hypothetical protein
MFCMQGKIEDPGYCDSRTELNRRAHLSGDRVMMQATIFGASCIKESAIKRRQDNDINASLIKLWRDDDFVLSSDDEQVQVPKKRHSSIFKAFMKVGRRIQYRQEMR